MSSYEVERVLARKIEAGGVYYLLRIIHIRLYGPEHDSWVPLKQCHCVRLIDEFNQKKIEELQKISKERHEEPIRLDKEIQHLLIC